MAETTTTTLTELVLAKTVDMLILKISVDRVRFATSFRFKNLAGSPTATHSFPAWVKDAHTDIGTETTDLTSETLETTTVDISVSRVGILREVTESSYEDTNLGRAGLVSAIIQDAAKLLGAALDEDAAAEFANLTTTVGATTVDLSIANLISAMHELRQDNAEGNSVWNLHTIQLFDLQSAQSAATATPWASFYQPNADGSHFGGFFMGSPIFSSTLNPTANAGADRVGALYSTQDDEAPFGLVMKRPPTTKMDEDISKDTHEIATITRYGVGTISTGTYGVGIVTDA